MNPRLERYKPLLWLGGIVIAGVLLIAVLRAGSDRAAPMREQAVAVQAPAAAPPAPAADAAIDTPPWLTAPGAGASNATRGLPAPGQRAPTAEETARAVAQLREQALRNERNADELLRQLDAMKASGQAPPGVDLDALRNNLLVTKRAQVLARELAELTQRPDAPDRRQRILSISTELQQLQSQLRYDVGTGAAAAPPVLPLPIDALPGRTP